MASSSTLRGRTFFLLLLQPVLEGLLFLDLSLPDVRRVAELRISPVDDSHFSEFGEGTALLYFERSALANAKDVVVSATIKDKPVAVKFRKKKLEQILQ